MLGIRRPFFMRRRLPLYGWFGLLVILVSQAAVFARIEPFYHWHTPIAWTAFILLADAVVWKRRANSWIRNNRSELLFVSCASVPLWVLFELYNKYSIQQLVLRRSSRTAARPRPWLHLVVRHDYSRDL